MAAVETGETRADTNRVEVEEVAIKVTALMETKGDTMTDKVAVVMETTTEVVTTTTEAPTETQEAINREVTEMTKVLLKTGEVVVEMTVKVTETRTKEDTKKRSTTPSTVVELSALHQTTPPISSLDPKLALPKATLL